MHEATGSIPSVPRIHEKYEALVQTGSRVFIVALFT
jgi:hypothetical protein